MAGVAERHVWDRMEPGWHLAFAVFAAVGAGLLIAGAGPPGSRAVALILLSVIVLAYATLGGRALRRFRTAAPGPSASRSPCRWCSPCSW